MQINLLTTSKPEDLIYIIRNFAIVLYENHGTKSFVNFMTSTLFTRDIVTQNKDSVDSKNLYPIIR